MKIVQDIILAILGFSGGLAVAGGVFAFISILGIVPRMADRMGLASHIYQMESVIAAGGVFGAILTVFQIQLMIGQLGLILFGGLAGIFIGALSMALAETLKVFPILCQRANLRMGLPVLVIALGLGKALGSLYQLYFAR